MTFFGRRQSSSTPLQTNSPTTKPKRGWRAEDASLLDWEFGDGDVLSPTNYRVTPEQRDDSETASTESGGGRERSQASAPVVDAFRREDAAMRVAALVSRLDEALEHWWSDNELPSPALLREGLLALQAGHNLDEGQRSLLLRSALAERKGVLTALRHQTDPERTAFILKEELLDIRSPLPLDILWRLRTEDKQSDQWVEFLVSELHDEIHAVQGPQQELAVRTLALLERDQPPTGYAGNGAAAGLRTWDSLRPILQPKVELGPRNYWSPGRVLISVLLIVALLIGYFVWQWNSVATAAIEIPAGTYPVSEPGTDELHEVQLGAFQIARSETTNADYLACINASVCAPPASAASATRPDYLTHPAYANFPVVNVTWDEALAYCTWINWRLPTANEWEVAASVAPATGLHYRYPWGDAPASRRANTSEQAVGDTQTVGSYSPAGDSPWGVIDMAGNVAEWTATAVSADGNQYFIKGGSFQTKLDKALVNGADPQERQFYANWLGFRCATDS